MTEKRKKKNEVMTELGFINISEELLSNLVGYAVSECYGVVGMSSKKISEDISGFFKKDSLKKGIVIKTLDDKLVINLNIVVMYGTRIPEVAHNVMEKVKYVVENKAGLIVDEVNINVEGVELLK